MSSDHLGALYECVAPLRGLDWDDLVLAEVTTARVLRSIADDRALLGALVNALTENPLKLRECEKDHNIQKYVLYGDPDDGFRLRLHVMYPSDKAVAHSHRMDFASLLLKGSYRHILYGPSDDGSTLFGGDEIFVAAVRTERADNPYYISNRMIHDIVASDECISLMLRSRHRKQRAIHYEIGTGRTWWRYGSSERTAESLTYSESVTEADIHALLQRLGRHGLI